MSMSAAQALTCLCGRQLSNSTRLRQHQDACATFQGALKAEGMPASAEQPQAPRQPQVRTEKESTLLQLAKARLIQGASRDTIEATKLGMRDAMKSAHMHRCRQN